jgi:arabinan endo-1,5-alpha-L-arabinosidase
MTKFIYHRNDGVVMKRKIFYFVRYMILLLLVYAGEGSIHALHNDVGAHDPTGIIKCDSIYWIFTTGRGPYAMYSNDLIEWTAGKTPLTPGSFPSWVTNYVPGFDGHFWAPDCFYMNGLYHLYYSCSSWGSTVSCIGLLTSKSLNPESADYAWTDEGVVVFSTGSSNYNCIDPAIMRDDEGKIWMTFGSHWDGIKMVELDSVTGLAQNQDLIAVAGKGDYKTEAAYVVNRGDFYYLFYNRGQCCDGASSTYYIQVGRSLSPTGPFLDKNGTDCYQGGGTTVFSTSGSLIGPGCIGYYVENNTEFVTYHYYDGTDGGRAKLGIGTFTWSEDDWPTVTNNWIEDGHYSILNENSQLAWDFSGSGAEQDPVIQNTYTKTSSQRWTFEALGNGFYSIIPGGIDLVAGITPCTGIVGTKIALGSPGLNSCQIWRVEKTNDLNYVFSSKYGNRVLEVPGSSTDAGAQFAINQYAGTENQRWMMPDTFLTVSVHSKIESQSEINVFPNPVTKGSFNIEFDRDHPIGECRIEIHSSDGRIVFSEKFKGERVINIPNSLIPNTYFLSIITNKNITCKKLIIL